MNFSAVGLGHGNYDGRHGGSRERNPTFRRHTGKRLKLLCILARKRTPAVEKSRLDKRFPYGTFLKSSTTSTEASLEAYVT